MSEDFWPGIIIGWGAGAIMLLLFFALPMNISQENKIEVLGGAICEEQHGMEFYNFYDDTLYCKNSIVENYDGIKIKIRGVE